MDPHKILPLKRRDNVSHGLLKRNQIGKLSETTELSMEEIHHDVRQFLYGTRNPWRQGQCQIKKGVGDQEQLMKTSIVKKILFSFSHKIHPQCFHTHTATTFNRAQGLTCDCTLTKCDSYRPSSQMINQDEKSLRLTYWNEFLRMKRSPDYSDSVMRQSEPTQCENLEIRTPPRDYRNWA